ncbi:MAG: GNAT family N-acetyltransferase [Armatimonadota bacterium]|nr:GNAT family N-acetyltransferase [Armatimonadota bacterium]
MNELIIRRAEISDAAILVEHNLKMALETEDFHLNALTVSAGVLAALQEESGATYYVAEQDGKVFGQLMVTLEWSDWRNGPIWWIQSVYVEPACRRRGVFRKLLAYIKDIGEVAGAVGFRLYVEAGNGGAQETYRCLGFVNSPYLMMELSDSVG